VHDLTNGHPHPPHPTPIPFNEPWQYELTFPGDPRGPAIARATLRTVLVAHHIKELTERAELLTSELATNSVCHTKGSASVRLQWQYPVLRVSVWDASTDIPQPAAHFEDLDPLAGSGRGLFLLEALADRWGGCAMGPGPLGPGGKTIWFELGLGPGRPPVALAA
jgi:anti-sigma regulatory factor (Ser/Thr protein kinase)